MDDITLRKLHGALTTRREDGTMLLNDDASSVDEEDCDDEAWETLNNSFRQSQTVLDHNFALIKEVNDNHQSKAPDNLVKNAGLICQINSNISKVLSIYSDLSVNFSNIVHQRRKVISTKEDEKEAGSSKNENSNGSGNEESETPQ